ncbi:MAG: methylamine utilization protein [Myxococcales bacterium]|nr:methylamine utilization protein [Myxococcales bacterium]
MHRIPVLVLLCHAGVAFAATTHVVSQKARTFSAAEIVVKAGEKVLFKNDDDVVHSLYTVIGTTNVNVVEPPGESGEIAFPTAGDYPIKWAIHPQMSLTVKVQ